MGLLDRASANEAYAWAAGVMDGEGCIHLALRRGFNLSFYMAVTNTDPRMVMTFAEIFHPIGVFRKSDYRTERNDKPVQQNFLWHTANIAEAQEVLRRIRKYLVVKGEEADAILALTPKRGKQKVGAEEREERIQTAIQLKEIKRDRLAVAKREIFGQKGAI